MTRDELWNLLLSKNSGMRKEIVSMRHTEFRRLFELVWREAWKEANRDDSMPNIGITDSGCSGGPMIEDLKRMMGMR